MTMTGKEAKIQSEINTIVKRHLSRIEKMLEKFFRDALKLVRNLNGDLTRFRRDQFADGLLEFFENNSGEVLGPIVEKIDYNIKHKSITIYKMNGNWTELFLVFSFKLSDKITVYAGIIVELIVKDLFVLMMKKNDLTEIVEDNKRPKRFYHYKSIEVNS